MKRSRDGSRISLESSQGFDESFEDVVESGTLDHGLNTSLDFTEEVIEHNGTFHAAESTRPTQKIFAGIHDPDNASRLQALLEAKAQLPLPHEADTARLFDALRRQLRTEDDAEIRDVLVDLVARLAREPFVDAAFAIEELVALTRIGSASSVRKVVQSLLLIGLAKPANAARMEAAVAALVRHSDPGVRGASLRLRAHLSPIDRASSDALQSVLAQSMADPDPRVRLAAVSSLNLLHSRGGAVDVRLYESAVRSLSDSFADARLEALKLIWVLSQRHPAHRVSAAYGDRVRLVDDAFAKVCQAVEDTSPAVRTQGCALLGSFQNVDQKFLLQTFSKEILSGQDKGKLTMGKVKNVIPAVAAQQGIATTGLGAYPEDVDDEEAASDDDVVLSSEGAIDLVETGAVGAFILGLEDEFYQVRSAAIDSICELSLICDPFAARAIDYLIDMFHDEIDSVRVNAIHSLRKMRGKVQLEEDQLRIVLSTLEDLSPAVRRATRALLMVTPLTTPVALRATIEALLSTTLQRFPRDRDHVYECLKAIGDNHPVMIESLTNDLLRIDPRFLSTEHHPDDPYYVGVAVVICNATVLNAKMVPKLPGYMFRHFRYLKDKYPPFFPDQFPTDPSLSVPEYVSAAETGSTDNNAYDPDAFLRQSLTLVRDVPRLTREQKFAEAARRIEGCCGNLKPLRKLDTAVGDTADFYDLSLKCYGLAMQVKRRLSAGPSVGHAASSIIGDSGLQLLRLSYRLQHAYLGVDLEAVRVLMLWRVFAHASLLVAFFQRRDESHAATGPDASDEDATERDDASSLLNQSTDSLKLGDVSQSTLSEMMDAADSNFRVPSAPVAAHEQVHADVSKQVLLFMQRLHFTRSYCEQRGLPSPPELSSLMVTAGALLRPGSTLATGGDQSLINFIKDFAPPLIAPPSHLHKTTAVFRSPVSNADKAVAYQASLGLPLEFEAELRHLSDPTTVMLQALFGSGESHYFALDSSAFAVVEPLRYRLETTIRLLHRPPSAEPVTVRFALVKLHALDVPDYDSRCLRTVGARYDPPSSASLDTVGSGANAGTVDGAFAVVPLCSLLAFNVHPTDKPRRR